MRTEVAAQGSTLTAAELRTALEGVDDSAPVYVRDLLVFGAVGEDLSLVLEVELEPCDCGSAS